MDIEALISRVKKAISEAREANIQALRAATLIEDVRYIQGMLDTMDDMEARLVQEYKKLNKEVLFDEE